MKMQRLTRKQIKEQLEAQPLEEILHIPSRTLTNKQKEYCKGVAMGKKKNQAYREAYNSQGNPKTIGTEVYRLESDPRIPLEIEARRRAIEFEKAYSAKQLRTIVISQLTKEALDPESKPSERITALKALGNVAELGVFIERKEVRTIKDSETVKNELMEKLKEAMKSQSITLVDDDAKELMDEIKLGKENLAAGGPPIPTPANAREQQADILHTIPHNQSPTENDSHIAGGVDEKTPL